MAESPAKRTEEIAALRAGLDLGLTLIDTAEMYADGGAEALVAEAIAGRRDEVFLVSKVYPHNASRDGTPAACERSLRRLKTDRIDLYLLHWRGGVPLEETFAAMHALRRAGKIRACGVSNFDADDMLEAERTPGGGDQIATNQVLYNLTRRGIEWDLLPWQRERQMPTMAYSPIEQGRMAGDRRLQKIAARRGASPAQIALAWLLRQPDVISIPKAGTREHVRENLAALNIDLTPEDLAEIEQAFPPPKKKHPLDVL